MTIAVVTYRRVHGGEGHGAGGPQEPRPRTGHLLHTHSAHSAQCTSLSVFLDNSYLTLLDKMIVKSSCSVSISNIFNSCWTSMFHHFHVLLHVF